MSVELDSKKFVEEKFVAPRKFVKDRISNKLDQINKIKIKLNNADNTIIICNLISEAMSILTGLEKKKDAGNYDDCKNLLKAWKDSISNLNKGNVAQTEKIKIINIINGNYARFFEEDISKKIGLIIKFIKDIEHKVDIANSKKQADQFLNICENILAKSLELFDVKLLEGEASKKLGLGWKIPYIQAGNISTKDGMAEGEPLENPSIKFIVIHHTATYKWQDEDGNMGAMWMLGSSKELGNGESQVSVHYIVGRNGYVYKLAQDNNKTWHAGLSATSILEDVYNNINNYSIGIEFLNAGLWDKKGKFLYLANTKEGTLIGGQLEKQGDGSYKLIFEPEGHNQNIIKNKKIYEINKDKIEDPISGLISNGAIDIGSGTITDTEITTGEKFYDKQIAAGIVLLHTLSKAHNISPFGILGHADIACGRKTDPHSLFPWKTLAAHGLIYWPKISNQDEEVKVVPGPSDSIKEILNKIGYRYGQNVPALITAFQMRYLSHEFRNDELRGKWTNHGKECAEDIWNFMKGRNEYNKPIESNFYWDRKDLKPFRLKKEAFVDYEEVLSKLGLSHFCKDI